MLRSRKIVAIPALCASAFWPAALAAQGGVINAQTENDLFVNGGDRHFTNGLRFSWFTPPLPSERVDPLVYHRRGAAK